MIVSVSGVRLSMRVQTLECLCGEKPSLFMCSSTVLKVEDSTPHNLKNKISEEEKKNSTVVVVYVV